LSKIEVNTVDVQCGSTLTLGSSGKTVTLATGASQSGFGRTGTVDWCTTAKTSPFTAVSGDGFFINTTGGAITVTLPSSPSAGDIVAFKDYAGTWDTNNVTVGRGGSKINGTCNCATLNTESQSVTLIYVDGTKGWQDIHDSTSNVSGNPGFLVATGGTITTSGDDKIHTFNSSDNFNVTALADAPANNQISYLVVAGGGGGSTGWGSNGGGGGGAGGFREDKSPVTPYTASPLEGSGTINATITTFPITVGGGGSAANGPAGRSASGSVSTFSTITSAGGGAGGAGSGSPGPRSGAAGGSGGGKAGSDGPGSLSSAGLGNQPPVSPAQGFDGGGGQPPGSSGDREGFGGGGATAAGGTSCNAPGNSGAGGAGATTSINASPVARAGGGAGGAGSGGASGSAGAGGGGTGGYGGNSVNNGTDGTANTGGGGGGGANGPASNGNSGGSGVVILRYKFQ
jgi:hypothetical protein